MSEEIAEYAEAREEYMGFVVRLGEIGQEISIVGLALQHAPLNFSFSGSTATLSIHRDSPPQQVTVDVREWQTAEEIMLLLIELHNLMTRVQDAWSAVPKNLRSSLQAPAAEIPRRATDEF